MSTFRRRLLEAYSFPYIPLKNFGGLMISPQGLTYDGNKFILGRLDYNYTSYGVSKGLVTGSSFFTFVQLGQYFDSRGSSFSASSGNIDNNGQKCSYGGYDDWRLPTEAEWEIIIGKTGNRPGSTINGVSGCKYAKVRLTGVTYNGYSGPIYFVIAPDGETMTGLTKTLTWNSETTVTANVTYAHLREYAERGCIIMQPQGYSDASYAWRSVGLLGAYHSSTQYSSTENYTIIFYDSGLNPANHGNKTTSYNNVRLVRPAFEETELEYIETDGTCYVDTDITPPTAYLYATASFFVAEFPTTPNSQYHRQSFYGWTSDGKRDQNSARIQNDGSNRVNIYYDYYASSTATSRSTRYGILNQNPGGSGIVSFKLNGSQFYRSTSKTLDPSSITSTLTSNSNYTTSQTRGNSTLRIMANRTYSDTGEKMGPGARFYGMNIYSSSNFSTITHAIRPYRLSDGSIGVIDYTTGRFYPYDSIDGTGVMTAGPAVAQSYP